ncbi:Unknown protein [Striga hermonthica]|uniref:Uncharacterized protein n=1 Tax=Striga hermonthica TaxID=68872 RepID=A0A9N7MVQ4_STRHE|nr:Unknown protein [Striga hermonthica]
MGRKRKTLAKSSAAAADEEKISTENPTAEGGKNTVKIVYRRSGRLKSSARSEGVEPIVEHVDLDEIEREEELPQIEKVTSPVQVAKERSSEVETPVEQVGNGPPKEMNERSLNEMVSYLVQAVDVFKHKVFERPNEDPSPDIRYKSLYLKLQKRVDALTKEKYELVRKLEFAEGQVAAFQKMIDGMGALKEVIFVAGSEKGTIGNASLQPQTVDDPVEKKRSHKKRKA